MNPGGLRRGFAPGCWNGGRISRVAVAGGLQPTTLSCFLNAAIPVNGKAKSAIFRCGSTAAGERRV